MPTIVINDWSKKKVVDQVLAGSEQYEDIGESFLPEYPGLPDTICDEILDLVKEWEEVDKKLDP